LRDEGKTYRAIADAWVSELGMPKLDAKSIQRACWRVLPMRSMRMWRIEHAAGYPLT
jgi:hypothetical protein